MSFFERMQRIREVEEAHQAAIAKRHMEPNAPYAWLILPCACPHTHGEIKIHAGYLERILNNLADNSIPSLFAILEIALNSYIVQLVNEDKLAGALPLLIEFWDRQVARAEEDKAFNNQKRMIQAGDEASVPS